MIPASVKSFWDVPAEAMQLTSETVEDVAKWTGGEIVDIDTFVNGRPFVFKALKIPVEAGVIWAQHGDFVVRWNGPKPMYSVYPLSQFSSQFTYE